MQSISAANVEKAPGYAELIAKMKEVAALGCTNVLHKPVVVRGTVAWSPNFPDGKDGACLNLLAATGDASRSLTGWVRSPSGKKSYSSNPGPVLDYVYCAEETGHHSVNVISHSNETYTFAAVDCPHNVALMRLGSGSTDRPASPTDEPSSADLK